MVSATGTKITGTGQVAWTVSRVSTGVYTITFPTAHPSGANYIISVTAQGVLAMVRGTTAPTSSSFQVVTYTVGTVTVVDAIFHFLVLAS